MIKFADDRTKPLVREMWKICFEDTEEFMNLHFSHKYKNENTLIYFVNGEAVASLQMFPYSIRFYGKRIPFYYLGGLCTLPQYRQKGFMAELIAESHKIMKIRNIPLSILVPAEERLYTFYEKYAYQRISEDDKLLIPLEEIIQNSSDLRKAYDIFDKKIQSKDFCVLKTYNDFLTIIEDAKQLDFPPRYNLAAMACIIDVEPLLHLYSQSLDLNIEFILRIVDKGIDSVYHISANSAIKCSNNEEVDLTINLQMLCRLLFGYRTSELGLNFSQVFPEHRLIINLMLE